MARIPPEDTPIYAQLLQEQAAREAYAIIFEDYILFPDENPPGEGLDD